MPNSRMHKNLQTIDNSFKGDSRIMHLISKELFCAGFSDRSLTSYLMRNRTTKWVYSGAKAPMFMRALDGAAEATPFQCRFVR
jgi:hypothetical protein